MRIERAHARSAFQSEIGNQICVNSSSSRELHGKLVPAMTDPVSAIIDSSGLLRPGECLRCEVCCRFPSAASPLAPYFSHAEMEQAVAAGMPADAFPPGRYGPGFSARLVTEEPAFRCPAFRPATNDCAAYAARPLDCRLYPFMLLYDADGKEVFLGLDTYCPARPSAAPGLWQASRRRESRRGVRSRRGRQLSSLLDGRMAGKSRRLARRRRRVERPRPASRGRSRR